MTKGKFSMFYVVLVKVDFIRLHFKRWLIPVENSIVSWFKKKCILMKSKYMGKYDGAELTIV